MELNKNEPDPRRKSDDQSKPFPAKGGTAKTIVNEACIKTIYVCLQKKNNKLIFSFWIHTRYVHVKYI